MKNKFRQNIVIGVIAIVGTMGYNLSINQENENVRLITGNIEALAEEEGGLDCNYNRHPSQCEIYVGAKGKVKLLGGSMLAGLCFPFFSRHRIEQHDTFCGNG